MTDLMQIAASLSDARPDADLPVDQWQPQHCGTMDLTIRADGAWIHEGTPMGRPAMVRLFSRILRKDDADFVLVTPVEKLTITVEDVPFLVVDYDERDGGLFARTNVGDIVRVDQEHPITIQNGPNGEAVPYIRVRGNLLARFNRSSYYRLVESAALSDNNELTISSHGECFSLGAAS